MSQEKTSIVTLCMHRLGMPLRRFDRGGAKERKSHAGH